LSSFNLFKRKSIFDEKLIKAKWEMKTKHPKDP